MRSELVPLVVDLDGTLLRTDTLWEAVVAVLRRRPWRLPWLVASFIRGRAYGKARLVAEAELEVELLPYREELLQWLREERQRGRRLILATAAPAPLAEALARRVDLFDAVLASTAERNLRGKEKLRAVQGLLGGEPFEYVGNSRADFPVWAAAQAAHVVGSPRFLRRVRRRFPNGRDFPSGWRWGALLQLLRPHQWVKNALVAVPLLLAHRLGEWELWQAAAAAFVALSGVASGLYVLNDLVDVEADRRHPRKRRRPLACGALPLWVGVGLAPALVGAAFGIAWIALPLPFLGALALYGAASMLYSLGLKTVPLVDVIVLAGLYTVRILAGGWATRIALSGWLLTFAIFLFLSLGFAKRYAELRLFPEAVPYARRGYTAEDEPMIRTFGTASGLVAVLVFVLYVNSPAVQALYRQPQWLWLTVPLWVYWIAHLWLSAHRRCMEDPVTFVLRDAVSYAVVGGIALLMVLASL